MRLVLLCWSSIGPEASQSGFGMIFFYFGLANFRRIVRKFLSKFVSEFFSANFSALFLQGFRPPPPNIHTQHCRHSCPISHSRTYFFTPSFCLRGRPTSTQHAPLHMTSREKLKGTSEKAKLFQNSLELSPSSTKKKSTEHFRVSPTNLPFKASSRDERINQ